MSSRSNCFDAFLLACPNGNGPRQGTQSQASSQMTCFKCNEVGHFANGEQFTCGLSCRKLNVVILVACPTNSTAKSISRTTSRTASRSNKTKTTSKRGRSVSSARSESKREPKSTSQFAAADGY